jgi:uncharacterized protein (TIGR02757 family)
MDKNFLHDFLEEKYWLYNKLGFIEDDPVSIPHSYSCPEDIEIAGFFASVFAWGQRKTIITKSKLLLDLMGNEPFVYIQNSKPSGWNDFKNFKHRTFQAEDCIYFIKALQYLYDKRGGIGAFFQACYSENNDMVMCIQEFYKLFFSLEPLKRTYKHLSNIARGAVGKRLNMYLRWMVRKEGPIDFGLWKGIPPSALFLPLDVHTSRVGRSLGLLKRKQNDWKAVEEITGNLKGLCPEDPVKYDIPLFSLGVVEGFC